MANLKTLRIVFENVDSIELPKSCIYNFSAEGITKSIGLIANDCVVTNIPTKSHLILRWNDVKDLRTENSAPFSERIDSHDIYQYILTFEDDSESTIFLPWKETLNAYNDSEYHIFEPNTLAIHHF